MSSLIAFPPLPNRPAPETWHFRHAVRIYWEDTDAGGIVFYGNYLKFMERARTEWLSGLGFAQEQMRRAGDGMFVVGETQIRYLRPARLDDVLTVTVTLSELGRASLAFQQEVWRSDTLLTQGRVRIGWVEPVAGAPDDLDDTFKPARIPARILAILPKPKPSFGG
ncbi:MAG: tol-pal system-associated acyl-CoA thioesterase [Burkholderiales bacterium]|nr:tol-pal system-associated acyl-CoA thioesterase [Burkholderiales bacterium]